MNYQDKIENTIVYKQKIAGDDKGILMPVLFLNDDGEFTTVAQDSYPTGIYVSQGFDSLNNTYDDNELFLLKVHYYDEEKSIFEGIKRYWTKGDLATPIASGKLIPIIETELPDVSHCTLSNTVIAPKQSFFINDNRDKRLYGPLKVSNVNGIGREQIVSPLIGDLLKSYAIEELFDCICKLNINGIDRKYILSSSELESRRYSTLDYISDSQLIQYFNKLALGRGNRFLAKREASLLQKEIANFEKRNLNNFKENERIERLKLILDDYLSATDIGPKIIKDHFESPKGQAFLEGYVKEHETNLLHEQLKKIEKDIKLKEAEQYNKIDLIDKKIEKKQIELQEIHRQIEVAKVKAEEEIQQIEEEAEDIRRQKLKEKEEILQEEIENLELTKKQKNDELIEILNRLGIANDLDEMNKRNIFLEESKTLLTQANKGLQESLQNPESLAKRMSELEIVSRVLKGGNVLQDNKQTFLPLEFTSREFSSATEIVESIRKYFDEDLGRSFSSVEMANLLISITQSFLTVLAGPPGVGKTSTVVKLADALKLGNPSEYRNFLYISVARGWVSSRDILGFYNSLNNTYQRARTGLFDFLSCPLESNNDSLQLILLDEANLSPMEHYWSDFLGMCDKEGRFKPIDTGIPHEERLLFVPKNTRFIATINNDSTTERLSPRLIDRVPVIYLEQDDDEHGSDYIVAEKLCGALPYTTFEKHFISYEAELDSAYENKLNTIIGILKERNINLGAPISISHRKRMAIINYCYVATSQELMDADTAFDFAISQHILPHIEGYGMKFRDRILKLQNELGAAYPRSSQHLERILASGNDFTGTYSFF